MLRSSLLRGIQGRGYLRQSYTVARSSSLEAQKRDARAQPNSRRAPTNRPYQRAPGHCKLDDRKTFTRISTCLLFLFSKYVQAKCARGTPPPPAAATQHAWSLWQTLHQHTINSLRSNYARRLKGGEERNGHFTKIVRELKEVNGIRILHDRK